MAERFSSVDDVTTRLRDADYLADSAISGVVFLADRLEKPVLVEGPAGVGKTELAKAIAEVTGARLIRLQCYEGLDEAIDHVNRFGSGHTEAIVTGDLDAARRFTGAVDAAVVIVNASTRFTDGERFGFGAEIGISTQKLHARGPMGLRELTTYKYVVWGDGQIRD